MAQAYALQLDVSGQLETLERSGTWGFRHGPGFGQVIAVMGTTAVALLPYQSLLQPPFLCATFCVIACIFFVVY